MNLSEIKSLTPKDRDDYIDEHTVDFNDIFVYRNSFSNTFKTTCYLISHVEELHRWIKYRPTTTTNEHQEDMVFYIARHAVRAAFILFPELRGE